ncbi:MAG: tetratricopeptide repeat protein [Thermoanaerobaculales bacterium]
MRLSSRFIGSLLVGTALFLTTPEAAAQMARISAKVVDPGGQPIAGVTLTVTTADSESYELVKTTNKKGSVTLSFGNVEWQYQLRLEKEGYRTATLPLQLAIGGTMRAEWTLAPEEAIPAEGPEEGADDGGGGSRAVRTYNEGVEAQRLGDLDLAEEKYRNAAEMNPELAAPHTALAAVASIREDWETVVAESEAALAIDPEDVRAMQLRFDACRNLGDEAKTSEAAAALRKIGDLEAAAVRIYNEAVEAYQAGDTAAAQSKLQQTLELDPEMVVAYVALAQINLVNGSPAEAAAMSAEALQREPDNLRALKISYDAARLSGNNESAASALDRIVELDPEWMRTVLFEHASKLFNSNQPVRAAFELEYVIKANPELARAHFMLGMALYNSGRAKEGREHLQAFIELTPDDPDVEIARGLMSYEE